MVAARGCGWNVPKSLGVGILIFKLQVSGFQRWGLLELIKMHEVMGWGPFDGISSCIRREKALLAAWSVSLCDAFCIFTCREKAHTGCQGQALLFLLLSLLS